MLVAGIVIACCSCMVALSEKQSKVNSAVSTVLRHANAPGSSDQSGDEWPMFRGALNHNGTVSTIPMQGTGLIWSNTTGGAVFSSPAVSGGRLYVGSYQDNKINCINATTGAKLWNYNTGGYVDHAPAVAGGRVYVGSASNGMVHCLDATTGILVWNYTTGLYVKCSPAIANGCVYVGSDDKKLYCLNATTGAKLWNYTTGGSVESSPAVAGGRVYVGSDDKKLYCLNATTGNLVWNYTSGGIVRSSPAVAGGRVYVGSDDQKLYCLNAATGAFIAGWNLLAASVESSPAVVGERVFVGFANTAVYCWNTTSGNPCWSYTTGGTVYSSPAVAGGYVYVGSNDGKMYCLNAITGDFLWSYTTGGVVSSSPAVSGGRVYVGSGDFKVYCFPMLLVPTCPQNLQAFAGNTQCMLAWQPPAKFELNIQSKLPILSYKIYRATASGMETSYTTIGNITSYTDWGVEPGHVYYYQVSAVNAMGEGPRSAEISGNPFGIPTAPWNLQASVISGHVLLTWTASKNNGGLPITSYTIYRALNAGSEAYYTAVGNLTMYLDTSVMTGLSYYYTVTSSNSAGEGTSSNEAIVTPAVTPAAPNNLQATSAALRIILSWQAPSSNGGSTITGYNVYCGTTSGGETLLVNLDVVMTFADTGLTSGQIYYYQVSAVNVIGESVRSIEASAKPFTVPGTPQALMVTPGNVQVLLTWTAPASNGGSSITQYKIYRGTSTGSETVLATVGNMTSYTDTSAMNGQTYYYTVSAVNGAGEGAQSTESSATFSSNSNNGGGVLFGLSMNELIAIGASGFIGLLAIFVTAGLHGRDKKQIAKQARELKEFSAKLGVKKDASRYVDGPEKNDLPANRGTAGTSVNDETKPGDE